MSSRSLLHTSPHHGVKIFAEYSGPIQDFCDVLIVGSGPAGAVIAKELAESGLNVILLEQGPPFGAADFRQEAGESMHRMLRERGTRVTKGRVFLPTMQVNGLGGGSLINSAICARAPASVFTTWNNRTGVELTREALDPHYARVEKFLCAEPTSQEILGQRNLRFKQGCDALGMSSEPTMRNVRGCKGSSECFTGCRTGAKQSVDINYVPAAIRKGATVYTSIRVEKILMHKGVAIGIEGHAVEPFTERVRYPVKITASKIVLAAGCMQTPVILQKSRLDGPWVGHDLQLHPGLAVMAMYEEAINPSFGATQGYHSLHYIEEQMKFEVLWAPPAILAVRLAGIGHEYKRNLLNINHMAPFDVITATKHSYGRVRANHFGWEPNISFHLHTKDMSVIQRGLGILSDICWASGAQAVLPGVHGIPDVLHSAHEADVLKTKLLQPTDPVIGSNHAFGSTRMSKHPRDGVVNEFGRHHDISNLYIVDTGIFAGSPAVNPMLTAMAIADRIAMHLIKTF